MASLEDPPLLSVVVPCLNEQSNIVSCLQKLQRYRVGGAATETRLGLEIIVVDGGSTDNTCELARRHADCVMTTPAGRARQMNAGAAVARGQWLLFLHTDTQLPENVGDWLNKLISTAKLWGFFELRLSGGHPFFRVIERAICWRARLSRVATGDQCQFVRRSVFAQLQGFAALPLMEDIELSRRLRKLSSPLIWRSPVCTSSRRWERDGILTTVLLMWWLRLAFFMGVSPSRLHRMYYRQGDASGE